MWLKRGGGLECMYFASFKSTPALFACQLVMVEGGNAKILKSNSRNSNYYCLSLNIMSTSAVEHLSFKSCLTDVA